MKKIILLLFAFLLSWQINAQVTTFANPDTGSYSAYQIVYNNNIHFTYRSNSTSKLAKLVGSTVSVVANPDNGDGLNGKGIVYNGNIYYQYITATSSSGKLYKYNGTSATLISNPDSGNGVQGGFIVFNNNLYFGYRNSSNKVQLAKFDGTSITLINNPNTGNVQDVFVEYNSNLYFKYQDANFKFVLAKFDGTSISLITNPDTGQGFYNSPVVYNNNLYFCYNNSSSKYNLAKFDGTIISLYTNPDTGTGFVNTSPLIFNNSLYLKYSNSSSQNQLALFDGTAFTLFANPSSNRGYSGISIILNNNLYFYCQGVPINNLAKFDGTSISVLANPSTGSGITYAKPYVFQDKIYYVYSKADNTYVLAETDGTTTNLITNPSATAVGINPGTDFTELNDKLYFKYDISGGFMGTNSVLGQYSSPCNTTAPTAAAQSFCGNATVANLVATGTGTINWYNVATGGTALATTTALTTGTYYVTQTISGCESPRTSVAVTINAVPTATATSNSPICEGQTLQLTGTGTGTYLWTAPSGGTSSQQNPSIPSAIPTNSGTYTFKVTGANGCITTVSTVVVVIPNTAPTAVSPQTLTTGSTIAAIGITASGSSVTWYDAATAGNVLSTTTTLVNGSSYYVSQTTNGCESRRKQITVNLVAPVTVSPATATVCTGLVTQLTASSMLTPTSNSGKIGSGTVYNSELFFNGAWGNTKSQALYSASELTALGLVAGSSINSIGFVMESGSATATFNNFNLSAGLVAQQTVTNPATDFIAGANTTVFSSASYTPNAAGGTIDYPLATPIIWDGTSALLVQGCFTNSNSGNNITGFRKLETTFYITPNERSISALKDNVFDACTEMFANFTNKGSNQNRPNLRVSYSTSTITWLPITDLYTNAAATTAYVTGANASSVYAKPTVSRTYTATSSNGVTTATATSVITVNPSPTPAQLAIARSGDVLTVAQAGATYQWYKIVNSVGVLISGATNQSYTATATGSYYAEVSINGCLAETDFVTITTLGTNDFDFNSKLSVYPNPSNAIFTIDIDSNATIEIHDLIGKQILTKKIELGTSQLDMSNYNAGMYLLKVTNADSQTKTIKIIKQ